MFKAFLKLILPVVLAAVVGASVATVMAREQPGDIAPAATPLGSGFTYQGKLTSANANASGPFDFQFLLYDAPTLGNQIGSTISLDDLQVTNGIFSAVLNFGAGQFTGDTRYLEVRVRAGSVQGAGGYDLLGRQELTATPYALYAKSIPLAGDGTSTSAAHSDHTHYGDTWTGNTTLPGLTIENDGAMGTGIKLVAVDRAVDAEATSGNGVFARSTSQAAIIGVSAAENGIEGYSVAKGQAGIFGSSGSGDTCSLVLDLCGGVYGRALAPNTPGVNGQNTDGYGVFGYGHYGVVGSGDVAGVLAKAPGDALQATGGRNLDNSLSNSVGNGVDASGSGKGTNGAGVRGTGSSAAAVTGGDCTSAPTLQDYCMGVAGTATGSSSVGVFGQGQKFGVYGVVTNPLQTNGAGILGDHGTGQYAGRFLGDVLVQGVLSVQGSISCPGCNPVLSDARAKLDIADLQPGLDAVLKLRPVTFEYNPDVVPDDTATHSGLIAQEVEEVLPNNVYTNPNGYLGVNYPELTPVLIRAIQQQQAQITALQSGVQAPSGAAPAAATPAAVVHGASDRIAWFALIAAGIAIAGSGGATAFVAKRTERSRDRYGAVSGDSQTG